MDKYQFRSVLEHMEKSFEKVNHELKTLRADPAQHETVTGIWFKILSDCSLDDCTRAIETIVREETQPKTVEGYPRRIRAYALEMARGRRGTTWGATIPEDQYLRDCAERANAIRAQHGLPPLAEPYKLCTKARAIELAAEAFRVGAISQHVFDMMESGFCAGASDAVSALAKGIQIDKQRKKDLPDELAALSSVRVMERAPETPEPEPVPKAVTDGFDDDEIPF